MLTHRLPNLSSVDIGLISDVSLDQLVVALCKAPAALR